MYPGSRFAPEPTRAECDAAEAAAEQAEAAEAGGMCFDLAEEIAMATDRRSDEWRADDMLQINILRGLLVQARDVARRIGT